MFFQACAVLSELIKGGGKILPVAQQPRESPVETNRRSTVKAGQYQQSHHPRDFPQQNHDGAGERDASEQTKRRHAEGQADGVQGASASPPPLPLTLPPTTFPGGFHRWPIGVVRDVWTTRRVGRGWQCHVPWND